MSQPAFELADIFRQYGEPFRQAHALPREQLRVMRAIEVCRTAALGGHVEECDHCSHTRIAYNSCRNRHCPKCQNTERARWLESRKAELLPVEYFHVVFTVPEPIARIAFYNPAIVYGILFRAVSETLLTIARDPQHLGAEIGFFAILHTWGQNLLHHPHVHCVIAGGGLNPDHDRWVACRPGFFLPVRVLSRLFRRLFLQALEQAFAKGKLQWCGELEDLQQSDRFAEYLGPSRETEWVVYAKPPFGGPTQVLEYLGRYTHRVAVSNERLLAMPDGHVTFQWKDYRRQGRHRSRTLTLTAEEFIRRFLIHVVPPQFRRIRHYGFLANRHRKQKVARCRQLLGNAATQLLPNMEQCALLLASLVSRPVARCPVCRRGEMIRVQTLPAYRFPRRPPDTS
jgi:hypothetical protein